MDAGFGSYDSQPCGRPFFDTLRGAIRIDQIGSSLEVRIVDSLISGNFAKEEGGAISTLNGSTIMSNCTLVQNIASLGQGVACRGGSLLIESSILWDGAGEVFDNCIESISDSNVSGGWPGGNIFAPPLFVDEDGFDDIIGTEDDNLRLLADSPCVDMGDPNLLGQGETDHDGNPRVVDGDNDGTDTVDMGAYERQGDCTNGDFDGDGIADDCDPDIDDDGVINRNDDCDRTTPGAVVDGRGRPVGDLNLDCRTDLLDHMAFMAGFTGP